MGEPLDPRPRSFFRRFDRSPIGRSRSGLLGLFVAAVIILGTTGLATWAVASGVFFPAAPETTRAARTHVVRTHGWGGFYVGPGAGRSHFGGGGRIH